MQNSKYIGSAESQLVFGGYRVGRVDVSHMVKLPPPHISTLVEVMPGFSQSLRMNDISIVDQNKHDPAKRDRNF